MEEVKIAPNGTVFWSFGEDDVCIEEYQRGIGWEERAAARLDGRTAEACMARGILLHLRSSGWMRDEMRRMGMSTGLRGAV